VVVLPFGDGTGPACCGRGRGFGKTGGRYGGECVRKLPVEERRKLLEQRKTELEAELKALEAWTE